MRMMSVRQRLTAVSIALATALALVGCQDTGDQGPAPTSADTSTTADTILLPGNTGPLAMTVARDGSLWVTEQRISAIARINPARQVAQYRIPGDSEPKGILQAPNDTIWYVGADQLKRIDTSGRTNGWMEDDGGLGYPTAITLGPDGAIWYDETGSPALIRRIDPSRGPSTVAVLPDGWTPSGMTSGPDGAVWFCEHDDQHNADAIGHVTPQGTYTSWPLPPGSYPWTIVTGPDDALWFTEVNGIGRITTAGVMTHFTVANTKHPRSLISGPQGALWFTTETGIGRLTPAGSLTAWPMSDVQALDSIVADPNGGFWLADSQKSEIRHFQPPS
ncbi:hypothetical protein ACFV1W_13290 [Kitasatospora sp. NPDC059648]|uniref:Vgb family protein n=1 Tax=Kitasatospora sp. NPDC059648 TaxID=3346894 RepID=UPI0036943D05